MIQIFCRKLTIINMLPYVIALGAAALLVGCASHIAKVETISGGDFYYSCISKVAFLVIPKMTTGKFPAICCLRTCKR